MSEVVRFPGVAGDGVEEALEYVRQLNENEGIHSLVLVARMVDESHTATITRGALHEAGAFIGHLEVVKAQLIEQMLGELEIDE